MKHPSFALLVSLLTCTHLLAASFDCAKANSNTERAICKDERLSDLDDVMRVVYKSVLYKPDAEQAKKVQREWLRRRDQCGIGIACLRKEYESRLDELTTDDGLSEERRIVSLSMRCDGSTETVLLRPSEEAGSVTIQSVRVSKNKVAVITVSTNTWHGECVFDSGASVRVKVGREVRYPYGECGAANNTFFSVWRNQEKIASQQTLNFECWGKTALVTSVVASRGIKSCGFSNSALECASTTLIGAAASRDTEEYPVKPVTKPELGSYVIEYAADSKLCKSMIHESSMDPSSRYWYVAPPKSAITYLGQDVEPSGGHSPMLVRSHFDIDNSGKSRAVVSIHYETQGRESSTFLAQKDKAIDSVDIDNDVDSAFLRKHTSLVFPHAWANCKGGFDRETQGDDKDCAIPLLHYRQKGQPFQYDVQYLRLRPFRIDGKTYFLGLFRHYVEKGIATVWEPLPSGKAKEICIFRRVANNF